MIPRNLKEEIIRSMAQFPVVGILGSRQVGKTTLAKEIKTKIRRSSVYLDLELPSDLNKLQDPELYLGQFTGIDMLVIIDEIQRMPGLFPLLRALVDQNRKAGRFLILGSASRDLIKQSSESLAGRVVYHELMPFNTKEVGTSLDNINKLWLYGGYPDSFLANSNEISFNWRQAFIATYLERDIPQLGIRIPAPQLRRFWTMIAHFHGQLWNANMIAKSLEVTAPTVKHYLDILEETFIIRQLRPYYANIKKRLVKSPKVYIRDSGLLHALLMNRTIDDLISQPQVGNSWEGFIIEQVIGLLPPGWEAYFYRTGAGAEIDLVIFGTQRKPIAVEIKYSSAPKLSRGFWSAFEDLGCETGYVIYPGRESYPLGRGVYTLPLLEIDRIVS
jgi:predicted AAA+ superfamily ATPase